MGQISGFLPLFAKQIMFRCPTTKDKIWGKLESEKGQNFVKSHSFFYVIANISAFRRRSIKIRIATER